MAHYKYRVHPHSSQAYAAVKARLSRRKRRVLWTLARATQPLTDRDVARGLGYADMNAVRPRITELIQDPDCPVEEVGERRDPETGRTVRLVAIVEYATPGMQAKLF